jgi:HD superfamily phosphohydrolase YqeK
MDRVAALLESWASALGLPEDERTRWRAAGYLHDALRDEAPDTLRELVPKDLRELPGPTLHGPAAATRLRAEGVEDEDLLSAVALHTIGGEGLGTLGRALYAADFLEPGRKFLDDWRASLRERVPPELDRVVLEIARSRIRHLLDRGASIPRQTLAFWNALVAEQR